MTKRQFQAAEYSEEHKRTRGPLETYRIVREVNVEKLQAVVNELMADGYQPTGGVAVAPGWVYQAMTRERTLGR